LLPWIAAAFVLYALAWGRGGGTPGAVYTLTPRDHVYQALVRQYPPPNYAIASQGNDFIVLPLGLRFNKDTGVTV
jgi:hypothetical protein